MPMPLAMNLLPTLQQVYAALFLITILIVITTLALIILQLGRNSRIPPNLPWVDLRGKNWFPKLRANFHQIVTGRQPISEGWEEVNTQQDILYSPSMS